MSVQQCQSKSTNESTEATSTVDAGRLFHLGMVCWEKSCICKHLYTLEKEIGMQFIFVTSSNTGVICYIIR